MKPDAHSPITLSDLLSGEQATLLQLSLTKAASNRLVSFGFTPGVEISMMQNYGRGPLVVNVRGMRVALGRREARSILVKKG
jgi:Fe2+ transport system protein FeoA